MSAPKDDAGLRKQTAAWLDASPFFGLKEDGNLRIHLPMWSKGDVSPITHPLNTSAKKHLRWCKSSMALTPAQSEQFCQILFGEDVQLDTPTSQPSQRHIMSDKDIVDVAKVSDRQISITVNGTTKDQEELFNTILAGLSQFSEEKKRQLLGNSPEGRTVSSLKNFKKNMGLLFGEEAQTGAKESVWDDQYRSFKVDRQINLNSLNVTEYNPSDIESEYEKLLREEGIADHLPTIDMDYLTKNTPEIFTFDWVDNFEQNLPSLDGIWGEPPVDAMKTLYPHRTFKASPLPPKVTSTAPAADPNNLKGCVTRWKDLSGWKRDIVVKITEDLFTLSEGVDRKAIHTLDTVCGAFMLSRFSLIQQTLWESPKTTEETPDDDVSFNNTDVTRGDVLSPLMAFFEETNINALVERLQSWFKEDDLFFRVRDALDIAPYADRVMSDLLYKNLICEVAVKVFGNKAIGDALRAAHAAVEKHVLYKLLLARLDVDVEAHLGDLIEVPPSSKKPKKSTVKESKTYNCDYCHDYEYADIGHECEHCGLNGINPYNYSRRK